MAKKRARLTDDNDPLSSTDQVLAGFEQLSQSTSQPVEKSESQPVNQSNTNQADLSNNTEVESSSKQEDEKQGNNQSARQKVKKSTSQLVKSDTSGDELTSQKDEKSTSKQVDKLELRKVTFQIQQSVVNRLDRLHLQLQLDLGKTNAPYKEVIVEEAISQLLEDMEINRDKWIEILQERQGKRK
ncbi:hypothetical protein [Crocosphaera sp.]|uniref:hypothetical protein n=1 Tax=Crocosphaera sp. TaxID=2729996 RepID=UPI00261A869C|nr:hypothetical protein [Crocosphaera sp.]MDJ0581141.1 hypothetical protein [Crocosphaera sp.]